MHVLVVEDNSINLAVLKTIVSRIPGCSVSGLEDPLEALSFAGRTPCDLVLVDFNMPRMNGVQFVQNLRENPTHAHVPVIMITADNDRDLRITAIEAGATDFLNKPVDPDELKVRVTNLLKLRKAQVELANRAVWLTREVEAATKELLLREEEMIWRLARAIEYRDGGTGEHINRVAAISRIVAEELGLDRNHCRDIYLAAPLHDVGKIGVSDSILNKPGGLDSAETAAMREHVNYGANILADGHSNLLKVAASIAKSHHERWDGTGYPDGLAGKDIPIEGRIAAIADVFDALCTDRPYKRAWSLDRAREHISSEAGAHFDPQCVAAFERAWPRIADYMSETVSEARSA
ncbi:HD domain-containing phosphohydrolase [Amaricoccus macauensis]|uniref:HD domain-containing phosphohydrolase n=1 Tax=Amaricoccus macauensis TaxID=57001 RepID=UPI003C7B6126